MNNLVLEMKNISKEFPGVKALDQVSLDLYEGEVLALLGENGAGKSTLVKILTGIYQKDVGEVVLNGEKVDFHSPRDSQNSGIGIINQEINLIKDMTVGENIYIGREDLKLSRIIDWNALYKKAEKILSEVGLDISPKEKVKNLGAGQMKMIEIAKALSLNANIIVMDEPTDALTQKETKALFKLIEKLKQEKKSVIYITHRLEEVFEICNRVHVLRDGKYIGSEHVDKLDKDEIIHMMVGRKLEKKFPRSDYEIGQEIMRVENLCMKKKINNVSFSLKSGEILGIFGLMGAGRTELGKLIFGAYRKDGGDIYLENNKIKIENPKDAIDNGIAYLSEDRKGEGLVLELSVKENTTLSTLVDKFKTSIFIDRAKEIEVVNEYVNKLNVKTPNIDKKIKNLSGGNQQKVALSKWLLTEPKVLILDEPTKGVDVGARREMYENINKIKEQGTGIILISSEMEEILGLSDTVMAMHKGEIRAVFKNENLTQEEILKHAVGEKNE